MGRTRRYCVMQIPSQMAITRVGAPIWLAILVFCWCVRLRRPRATCCLPPAFHARTRRSLATCDRKRGRCGRGAVAAASAGMNSRNTYIGVRFLLGASLPPLTTHWHVSHTVLAHLLTPS